MTLQGRIDEVNVQIRRYVLLGDVLTAKRYVRQLRRLQFRQRVASAIAHRLGV